MKVTMHRRKQWDLWRPTRLGQPEGQDVTPFLACHVQRGNVTRRLFVLWRNGFRGFGWDVRWCTYSSNANAGNQGQLPRKGTDE